MRRFRFTDPGFEAAFSAFADERRDTPQVFVAVVREVIAAVRADGLAALLRFAREFDKVELDEQSIRVSEAEILVGVWVCLVVVCVVFVFAAQRNRR